MIILRQRKPNQKILYIHGKDEEIEYPGGGWIYQTLKKYFNIEFANISSDPKQGYIDFNKINFSDYSLVIGFSMGGVYASSQNEIPIILINPGYGLSGVWPEFKKIDNLSKKVDNNLVECVIIGTKDKHKDFFYPGIVDRKLTEKVTYIPIKHIPTEDEVKKYIIPIIKEYI